ncbi:hypothetical protein [Streptomyces sp. TLI_171]|uniref:hypothetical protein n=1 Tax=Streptomyces sp. TLI_171 TaxID=1938859 RepID=UPI000C5765A5|nr:hypothetical protein [Streptomyces sp. TLI_171]RKE05181.1 hypothetical protein BX266_7449 [Streptomyces sp. TLI_171]
MSRTYYFHLEYAGNSLTATVTLGTVRELSLLVNGHEAANERLHGHHGETHVLRTVLPGDPPGEASVEVTLPGPLRGEPQCILVAPGRRLPMPQRPMPHDARPTEASWYG